MLLVRSAALGVISIYIRSRSCMGILCDLSFSRENFPLSREEFSLSALSTRERSWLQFDALGQSKHCGYFRCITSLVSRFSRNFGCFRSVEPWTFDATGSLLQYYNICYCRTITPSPLRHTCSVL